MRSTLTAMSAAILLAIAAGCSSDAPIDTSQRAQQAEASSDAAAAAHAGYEEQCEMLLDDVVTEDEYLAALDLMQSCFDERGYRVNMDDRPNPVDGLVYGYAMDPGDTLPVEFGDVVVDCEHRYMSFVTNAYVRSQDPAMDPALADAVAACLEADDYSTSDDATRPADFIAGDPAPSKDEIEDCISAGITELWPDWEFSYSLDW